MPDCNPNPRRYSEEESRMKGVAFSEDIVLLPIPEIPENNNCPEKDVPPEAQVRVNQRIVFSTVTQTIDRIIDGFADVVKEVTKTVTLTDTVTNTVTSTVTQTITHPRVCSPCPACTPHTATASPTASASPVYRMIRLVVFRASSENQNTFLSYCNRFSGGDTIAIVYALESEVLLYGGPGSFESACAPGSIPRRFFDDELGTIPFNGVNESNLYIEEYCWGSGTTNQNPTRYPFMIDHNGFPHTFTPRCPS